MGISPILVVVSLTSIETPRCACVNNARGVGVPSVACLPMIVVEPRCVLNSVTFDNNSMGAIDDSATLGISGNASNSDACANTIYIRAVDSCS